MRRSRTTTVAASTGRQNGPTNSNLLILNPDTGAVTLTVGPIGFAVTGLAFHPQADELYGSTSARSPTNPRHLIRIDPTTGVGTVAGDLGADDAVADITFRSDGTLFGWLEATADDLVRINAATGLAAIVGIHEETIRRWAREGAIPAAVLGNRGGFRFKREDLDRFLESRRDGGPGLPRVACLMPHLTPTPGPESSRKDAAYAAVRAHESLDRVLPPAVLLLAGRSRPRRLAARFCSRR